MADNGEKDATLTLFQSVLMAMQGVENAKRLGANQRYPLDDSAQRELQDWWRCEPLGGAAPATVSSDRYVGFYRRLVDALRQQQLVSGKSNDNESIDVWVQTDWDRDEPKLLDSQVACAAFSAALHAIALVWVSRTNANDASELLSVVKQLREHCSGSGDGDPPTAVAEEKRPVTMAEKLSRMRSKRTAQGSDSSATTQATATESGSLTDSTTTTTTSSFPIERGDDNASHYFTIETRLELKERLATLQLRLDDLLLQTKLAWMKCFAYTTNNDDYKEVQVSTTTATEHDAATRLVTEGETLAFHLLDALEKAHKATCPIDEYKTLVVTCEAEFDAFQTLVNATAAAPSPTRAKVLQAEPAKTTASTAETLLPVFPIQKPLPGAFDLPSMKAYYDKAAPSYAAYLAPKKR